MPITVSIADDHRLFRTGLSSLINDLEAFEVTLEAENGKDLVNKLDIHGLTDLVLVDIEMPVQDGPDTVRILREKYGKSLKILALSMHKEYRLVDEMLKCGANGFLSKDATSEELNNALNSVYSSDFYLNKEMSRVIFGNHYKTIETEVKLTEVEQQIVVEVCKQKTNAEIADTLNLSLNTINSYRTRIIDKIGATNTAGLVIYAIRTGLFKV